jgi:endonuclease/exonuclease/phosphatase family metal-dependent hydrolase
MLAVSNDIWRARTTPALPQTQAMPPVAAPAWHPPLFDRVGRLLMEPRPSAFSNSTPPPPAAPPAPSPPPSTLEQIKVMTYNLHGGMGERGYLSSTKELDALANSIRSEQPDVLLLQEVDHNTIRSNGRDVLSDLAKRLQPTAAVNAPAAMKATGESQGVGVMTFNGFSIDNARNLIHPDPIGTGPIRRAKGALTDARKAVGKLLGRNLVGSKTTASYFPRNTIDTIVTTPRGQAIRVLSGHYSGPTKQVDYQSEQFLPLAHTLQAWNGPTILGADFNIRSANERGKWERSALGAAGLIDAFAGAGIKPGDQRRLSTTSKSSPADIDRIYSSKHFGVKDVHVVQEKAAASDHHPVVSTFEFDPKATVPKLDAAIPTPPPLTVVDADFQDGSYNPPPVIEDDAAPSADEPGAAAATEAPEGPAQTQ